MEIEAFVDRESINPMYFDKPYYLVPAKKAEKGYVLLREALKKTGKVGIARVVIRTRQYLGALMPPEDALILNLMRFPQELVKPDEFTLPTGTAKSYRINPKEVEMASQLLESMTAKWNPEDYKDEFRARPRKIIDTQVAKQSGKKVKASKVAAEDVTPDASTNVVDFMALLKRSLNKKGGAAAAAPKKSAAAEKRPRSTKLRAS